MLLTPLLSLLAPHECLGCGTEGFLICANCKKSLKPAVERCYSCHKSMSGGRTCPSCRRSSSLYSVRAAVRYEGAAKDLIWKLKFGRARAAAAEASRLLGDYTRIPDSGTAIITHAPTATNRIRRRGYDQAALIAKAFAQNNGQPYTPLLARLGTHKQVGASRMVRSSQLQEAFRPIHEQRIRGAHIILIDDVVTTGATLQAAAAALREAGAKRVEAIVFAQA